MDKTEKLPTEVIRAYISSLLLLEPKMLIIQLFSQGFVTLAEKNSISGGPNVEQMDKLLTLLLKKLENYQRSNDKQSYNKMFDAFLVCLADKCLLPTLAQNMNKYQLTGEAPGVMPLNIARSTLGMVDLSSMDFFGGDDESDSINYHFVDNEQLKLCHYYAIDKAPDCLNIGYVLILDVRDYSTFLNAKRSSTDCDILKSTFESLNYKVSVEVDLTAVKFASEVEKHLMQCEQGKFSNFILFVLAFGDESDMVCGVDGQSVSLISIRRKVQDFPYLNGCPKLFFFLSSRGSRPQPKVSWGEAARRLEKLNTSTQKSIQPINSQNNENNSLSEAAGDNLDLGNSINLSLSSRKDNLSTSERCDTVPKGADTFVCYACQRNYTVFGLKDKGSWFCNIFCGLVRERCKHLHLMDIMAEVCFYMSSMKLCGENSEQKYGQLPECVTNLRKQFYFVYPD